MKQICRLVALAVALLAAPAIAAADCPRAEGFEIEAAPRVETAPTSKKVEIARCREGGLCIAINF